MLYRLAHRRLLPSRLPAARAWIALAVLAANAGAQELLAEHVGAAVADTFGESLDGGRDVNDDGFDDLVIGSKRRVTVFSGLDGSELHSFSGSDFGVGISFGDTVALAGDVDGDGFADFIAAAPIANSKSNAQDAGRVWVFSGQTGAVLRELDGLGAFDHFGRSLAGVGDLDLDGFDDFVIGAERDSTTGAGEPGSARVYSGATGQQLFVFPGDYHMSWHGWSAAGAGDVDGDGRGDVIVGAPSSFFTSTGYARVYSGVDGSELFTFPSGPLLGFGIDVDGAGDVDGDGHDDVLVGSASDVARLYSGATGQLLREHSSATELDRFGRAVGGLGDLNGDGFGDYAIGAPQLDNAGKGYVQVIDGRTGAELYRLTGESLGDEFGACIAGAGDLNGDTVLDFAISAPRDNTTFVDAGRVAAFSPCPFPVRTFCTSKTNSAGCVPLVYATGVPRIAAPLEFAVRAHQVLEQKAGLFFLGFETQLPGANPNFLGSWLCVGGAITRTAPRGSSNAGAPPCKGTFEIGLDEILAKEPLEPGRTVFGQWWYRDGGLPFGVATTNAIEFTVCP